MALWVCKFKFPIRIDNSYYFRKVKKKISFAVLTRKRLFNFKAKGEAFTGKRAAEKGSLAY